MPFILKVRKWSMAKRFVIETTSLNQRFSFISDHKDSKLYWASTALNPEVLFVYKKRRMKNQKKYLQ